MSKPGFPVISQGLRLGLGSSGAPYLVPISVIHQGVKTHNGCPLQLQSMKLGHFRRCNSFPFFSSACGVMLCCCSMLVCLRLFTLLNNLQPHFSGGSRPSSWSHPGLFPGCLLECTIYPLKIKPEWYLWIISFRDYLLDGGSFHHYPNRPPALAVPSLLIVGHATSTSCSRNVHCSTLHYNPHISSGNWTERENFKKKKNGTIWGHRAPQRS